MIVTNKRKTVFLKIAHTKTILMGSLSPGVMERSHNEVKHQRTKFTDIPRTYYDEMNGRACRRADGR